MDIYDSDAEQSPEKSAIDPKEYTSYPATASAPVGKRGNLGRLAGLPVLDMANV
jgi:hypothetical protein